ncbi:unnamed protein product [Owenia fusiformis]|uniref:Uncharacterized protein n=1 Tax=Owenia fusiformis TaxID=6347 RepID=A0A8J1U6D7_OWEFU|nr:unnamed protein product [Owenia fusiformis]
MVGRRTPTFIIVSGGILLLFCITYSLAPLRHINKASIDQVQWPLFTSDFGQIDKRQDDNDEADASETQEDEDVLFNTLEHIRDRKQNSETKDIPYDNNENDNNMKTLPGNAQAEPDAGNSKDSDTKFDPRNNKSPDTAGFQQDNDERETQEESGETNQKAIDEIKSVNDDNDVTNTTILVSMLDNLLETVESKQGTDLDEIHNEDTYDKETELYEIESETWNNATETYLPKTKKFPGLIIIGIHKCGTYALSYFLEIHPNLVRTPGTEIHFFDRMSEYKKGLDYYISQMPLTDPTQIGYEKTPGYFDRANPRDIYNANKDVKLAIIACDPVRRTMSHHLTKTLVFQKNLTYEGCILHENGILNTESCSYIYRGHYATYFKRYLEVFPKEQILVVSTDELKTDPISVIKKFETFLKLPKVVNENMLYFDEASKQFCVKPEYWNRKFIGKYNGCMLRPDKHQVHPEIHPELVKKLASHFKDRNREFEQLTGKNFSWAE